MNRHAIQDRLLLVLAATLLVLAGTLVLRGLYLFSIAGHDLTMRWVETQYVLRGENPFDVYAAWWEATKLQPALLPSECPAIDPVLGVPQPSYPPWFYTTALVILWPQDPQTAKYLYVAANLAALGSIAAWLLRRSGCSQKTALLTLAAAFAADSVCTTLAFGQLGILTTACLLAALALEQRGRHAWSGLFLGLALLKPTLSGPFVLVFLVTGRWKPLAVVLLYTAFATATTCTLTGTNPLRMLQQMEASGTQWGITHYTSQGDAVSWLAALGFAPQDALRWGVLACTAVMAILFAVCRNASLMTLFAIAAIGSRVWVSHFHYDDVILIFVLFALVERRRAFAKVAAILLAVLLALPHTMLGGLIPTSTAWTGPAFDRSLLLCQAVCLIVLIIDRRPRGPST